MTRTDRTVDELVKRLDEDTDAGRLRLSTVDIPKLSDTKKETPQAGPRVVEVKWIEEQSAEESEEK